MVCYVYHYLPKNYIPFCKINTHTYTNCFTGISQAEPSVASTSRRQLSMPPAPVRRSPSRLTSPLPPAPTTPPSTSRPPLAAPSPNSTVTSPHRRHLRARRRRAQTPFERATSEFVAVEQRRLQVEEMRERNNARRIEVEHDRNNLLSRFLDIADALLGEYLQNRRAEQS